MHLRDSYHVLKTSENQKLVYAVMKDVKYIAFIYVKTINLQCQMVQFLKLALCQYHISSEMCNEKDTYIEITITGIRRDLKLESIVAFLILKQWF